MSRQEDLHERFERLGREREIEIARLRSEYDLDTLAKYLKPIGATPQLWRTNGFGVGLYGWINDHRLRDGFVKLYFLTALWIPIFPLSAYVVSRTEGGYRFYYKIGLFGLLRTYGWRTIGLYFTALLEGIGWLVAFGTLIFLVYGFIYWLRRQL
jgi:hypothetical protein